MNVSITKRFIKKAPLGQFVAHWEPRLRSGCMVIV